MVLFAVLLALSPEDVLRQVSPLPSFPQVGWTAEGIAEARATLEEAAAREPRSLAWPTGLAHVLRLEAKVVGGEQARARRHEARESFARLTELDPGNADLQFWYGYATFETIDDVGLLSKVSVASAGRKAFERALAIDPSHVSAHYALGTFLTRAPAIVGGSRANAREQGRLLLALPGGRGAFWGAMLLGDVAAAEGDWTGMSARYVAAETAGGEGADPRNAIRTHASMLLHRKEDPRAALALLARHAQREPRDPETLLVEADTLRALERCAEAVVGYEKALAALPSERDGRLHVAQCYERIGDTGAARRHYEEFARRFPDDDRAAGARRTARRLAP